MHSELVVVTYPSPDDAEQVVHVLQRLQSEHLLELQDVVYCTRDEDGEIAVYQSVSRPLERAALGAFWGTFLGKCFNRPLLGAALGAAGGALVSSRTDRAGIDPDFVRKLSATVAPGSSAVFALVVRHTPGRIMPELGQFGGTVLHTSLPEEDEQRLQAAIDQAHHRFEAQRADGQSHARRIIRRK
jgi:uncharacterized membrane protein